MLVSHESPLCLLEQSRHYNDYEYCLVHLLEQSEPYKQFFFDSVKMGRHVLLDNSIFELGTAFDTEKFAKWVVELNPTEYIVPDVLENCDATIENFENWNKTYKSLPGKKIGVVQGKSFSELVKCYKYMSTHADKIAISFDYSYYSTTGFVDEMHDNKWYRYMAGRQQFLTSLVARQYWCYKPHHLLGAALPGEFGYYNNLKNVFDNIETIDTSNPIIAGMFNVRYTKRGLDEKITTKLADSLNMKLDKKQLLDIEYNIQQFKILNNIKST